MKKVCATCKHDGVEPCNEPCISCRWRSDGTPTEWEVVEHYEPMTNADRIRAMSDEELKYIARAILNAEDCPAGDIECTKCVFHSLCLRSEYYYGNEGEWLKQPVEG